MEAMSGENSQKFRTKRHVPYVPRTIIDTVDQNSPHEVTASERTEPHSRVPPLNGKVLRSAVYQSDSAFTEKNIPLGTSQRSGEAISASIGPTEKPREMLRVKYNHELKKSDGKRRDENKFVSGSSYNIRHDRPTVRLPATDIRRSTNKSPLKLMNNPVLASKIKNLVNATQILDLESERLAERLSPTSTTHSDTSLRGNKSPLHNHHHHHLPRRFHARGHNHAIKRAARKHAARARHIAAIASFFGARTPSQPSHRTGLAEDTTNTLDGSTTSEPGSPPGPGFSVPGVLLACVSVIFIIIGIAFVYSRLRRSKPTPERDQPDIEMKSPDEEKDPYMEWLNMPEEPLPPPALGKQMKTAVRTVSRKMSLTPKPPVDDFQPGVPPHLRYQLKEIYVY